MLLHAAVASGAPEAVWACLADGGDVDEESQTSHPCLGSTRLSPLHVAAGGGSVEVVAVLLEAGADVHREDSLGLTPLCYASSAAVVHELCMWGAEPSPASVATAARLGHTTALEALAREGAEMGNDEAIHEAVVNADLPVLRVLLRYAPNAASGGALFTASMQGDAAMVQTLLQGGAPTAYQNTLGSTPLHAVVLGVTSLRAATDTIGALHRAGAVPCRRHIDGATPIDLAHTFGKLELATALRNLYPTA
eukprot:Sspe_Gene.115716::Locus_103472_Transcript_1_1_Confidence_1.000_Length_874::g.115716::m.115716